MARSRKKSPVSKRRLALIVGGVIILLGLVFSGYSLLKHRNEPKKTADANSTETSKINYNPPTEAEKQQSTDSKNQLNQPQQTPTVNTSDGKTKVTPIISSADKNGVGAYVPGIFEEGGTCVATYVHGDDKIIATSQGLQNSNYTSCAPIKLTSPLNIPGTWTVTVSYTSSTSSGTSAASQPIQVQ